jgi:phospholipid/cholesterol/gamma-HCH transport system substrate-binding protein
MKIRNEVKVGILGIVAIFLLIWGYYFLKGSNILSSSYTVTTGFNNVDGLAAGAPVTIKGYQVGAVTDLYIDKNNPSLIKVTLTLDKATKVPKNAIANLVQPNIMSGKTVELKFEGGCDGENCLKKGDFIEGRVGSMFDMVAEAAKPYVEKIDSFRSVIEEIAKAEEGGLRKSAEEIQATVSNLKVISDVMAVLLEKSTGNFVNTMDHLESITGNVRKNNEQITTLMANVTAITEQLKNAELDKTVSTTRETVEKFGKVADDVKTVLAETNKLMTQLQVLTDLSKQDGLLAALVNDKQFLADVKKTIDEVSLLVEDIREHPERYRTVLSGKYKPYGTGKAYEKEKALEKKNK